MMKATIIDAKQWILRRLLDKGIQNIIDGKILTEEREVNSQKEDISIGSLTITNEYLQDGVLNVNCFVPKKQMKIGGISQWRRNTERLRIITRAVNNALNDVWMNECHFFIEYQQEFSEEKETYYNFRVKMKIYPN